MLVPVEQALAVAGLRSRARRSRSRWPAARGQCAARAAPTRRPSSADAIVTGSPSRRAIWIASPSVAGARARVGPWRSAAARRESSRTRSALSPSPTAASALLEQRDEALVGQRRASRGTARRSRRRRGRTARAARRIVRPPPPAGTSPSARVIARAGPGRRRAPAAAGSVPRVAARRAERRERQLVQAHRLLVGEQVDRAVARAAGVLDRLVGVAAAAAS